MKLHNAFVVSVSLLATACASQPDSIQTAYVSPAKYAQYDCQQIVTEMDHVGRRTTALHTSLKNKADGDTAQMAIGMILFWPALFFLEGGDGPEAAEYATLKGDYEALRSAGVQMRCDANLFPAAPEMLIKQEEERKKAAEAEKKPA